jgi:hypothetical protein
LQHGLLQPLAESQALVVQPLPPGPHAALSPQPLELQLLTPQVE